MTRRLAVTLVVAVLAALLARTPMPGLADGVPPAVGARLTLAGGGLLPFFACFGIFGLAVVGGDTGKVHRLRSGAPLVAGVIALVQGLILASWRNGLARGGLELPPAAAVVANHVGGTLALFALGALGTRFGLASGFLVVEVALSFARGTDARAAVVIAAVAVALALVLPRWRDVPVEPGTTLRLPLAAAGTAALAMGTAMAFLGPTSVAAITGVARIAELLRGPWVTGPLSGVLVCFFAFFVVALSYQPWAIVYHAARPEPSEPQRIERAKKSNTAWDAAVNPIVLANGIVLGLVALARPFVLDAFALDLAACFWIGATLAATVVDARDDARAQADLERLGEAPGVLEAGAIAAALGRAGIPVVVRRRASRLLCGVFGGFLPLEVSVAADDAARARTTLDAEAPFLVGSPALDARPPLPTA